MGLDCGGGRFLLGWGGGMVGFEYFRCLVGWRFDGWELGRGGF